MGKIIYRPLIEWLHRYFNYFLVSVLSLVFLGSCKRVLQSAFKQSHDDITAIQTKWKNYAIDNYTSKVKSIDEAFAAFNGLPISDDIDSLISGLDIAKVSLDDVKKIDGFILLFLVSL